VQRQALAARRLHAVIQAEAADDDLLLALVEPRENLFHLPLAEGLGGFLADLVGSTGLRLLPVRPHELDAPALLAVEPDWVIVDSYQLDAVEISALGRAVPVLAIVDGDIRGIEATLYLEQNVGSEHADWAVADGSRVLAGPAFALVRSSIRAGRRETPWRLEGTPRVLAFMGGTDATGAIVPVSRALASVDRDIRVTVIAAPVHRDAVLRELAEKTDVLVVEPRPDIASLMAESDIVVSASGTSAWEVGTLGLPSVLIAVVENQRASLAEAVRRGFVLGVDVVDDPTSGFARLADDIVSLCDDEHLRRSLSEASTAVFDGRGATRVIEAMEGARR